MASHSGAAVRPRADDLDPSPGERDSRSHLSPASLFLVLILFWMVTRVEYVIVLALFGLLLGTILEGPVHRLESRKIPRPAAIFMIYAGIIGLLVALVFLIIPVISGQTDDFREEIPAQIQELEDDWRASSNALLNGPGASFLQRSREYFDNPNGEVNVSSDTVQNVIPVVSSITAGVVGIVTTLVITFYYLMERAFIRKLVISQLHPNRQARVDRIWQDVENKVGGWMRGQLVLCLIIGTIATVSYGIVGLPFWPLLGLWAGLTEIIPIVGPWIGGVPAVIVALTQGWQTAVVVGIIIIGMQTLENWFLVPRVMRGAVGLSPLTVFVAILTGTTFMGVTGAILAIPIAAGIQVILSNYFAARQVQRDSQQPSGWRWMLNRASSRYDPDTVTTVEEYGVEQPSQTISVDLVPGGNAAPTPAPPAPEPASAAPAGPAVPAAPRDTTPGRRRNWSPFSGTTAEPPPANDDSNAPKET